MNYFEERIHHAAAEAAAQIEIYDFIDSLLTDIRYHKLRGDLDVKSLEFFLNADQDARIGWIHKALLTAEHHQLMGDPNHRAEFFVECKKLMKKDREAGVKLW